MNKRQLYKAAGFVIAIALCIGSVAMGVQQYQAVGRQDNSSVQLETNQTITPAGQQVEFIGRPMAATLSPDKKTLAVLNGYGKAIVLIQPEVGVVKQIFEAAGGSASFTGILYAPDGKTLYASQADGHIIVADVSDDGFITLNKLLETPKSSIVHPGREDGNAYPGGLALSNDGATLYVTLNRNNTLGVLDLATGTFTNEIAVGNAPFDVVVNGSTAYVSNRGGRVATNDDFTVNSSGTPIVADENIGYATTGTVSVVDLSTGEVTATIDVGLHPGVMLLDDSRLFVANANDDTISVIDTATNEVVQSIAVKPFTGSLLGSSPNALAMLGENRLAVSLGRNNAVAIYSVPADPRANPVLEGLVPTGFYPLALAVDTEANRLIVANGKGVGSLGPSSSAGPDPATNKTAKNVHSMIGSVSVMPIPSYDELPRYSVQVAENNSWTKLQPTQAAQSDAAPVPIPQNLGEPSVFKHVFYIIRENRTYDQVFSDMPQGNGDPSLLQFGREVTPNAHALAERFGLLDNVYASGLNSADGHQWSTQAFANDYLERSYGGFIRTYPFNGGDSLVYTPSGFLWDNALGHGKTVRNYGEYVNGLRADGTEMGPWTFDFVGRGESDMGTWTDFFNNWKIMTGRAEGEPHVKTLEAHSDVPSLQRITNTAYPPYNQIISDQYRTEVFLKEFDDYVANNNLPDLVMLCLTNDHTMGVTENYPTPSAMVADNDVALGRIVEAITNSPYWKESIIFVIEDDAQDGVDHVSGHRMPALVISPYNQHNLVDSTYYTQITFVREMEQILGLPPMNQMDMAVDPSVMSGLFTSEPNLTPYKALPTNIPFDEMNPKQESLNGLPLFWSEAMATLDFSKPDMADKQILNRAVWYATKGYDVIYPGDPKVFAPDEVHSYLQAVGRDTTPLPDVADLMLKQLKARDLKEAPETLAQQQLTTMFAPSTIGDGR